MADDKIKGSEYLLFIDPAGGTSYDTVVCLENFSFEGTTDEVDASSMCGPDKEPGTKSQSITFDAQQLINPTTGKISGASIFTLWQDSTTIGWKIARVTPISGDITKAGQGFISSYTENHTVNDVVKFSSGIGIKGDVVQTITP